MTSHRAPGSRACESFFIVRHENANVCRGHCGYHTPLIPLPIKYRFTAVFINENLSSSGLHDGIIVIYLRTDALAGSDCNPRVWTHTRGVSALHRGLLFCNFCYVDPPPLEPQPGIVRALLYSNRYAVIGLASFFPPSCVFCGRSRNPSMLPVVQYINHRGRAVVER